MDADKYEAFLRSIQPVTLGLTKCEAELDRKAFWKAQDSGQDRRMLSADYRVDGVGADYFNITADFIVVIQAVDQKGAPEKNACLKVQCAFYGHFHAPEPVDENFVRRFADGEARIFFVPYMRQFVSDMTSRMSIPPVMIPLAVGTGIGQEAPALPGKEQKKLPKGKKKARKS